MFQRFFWMFSVQKFVTKKNTKIRNYHFFGGFPSVTMVAEKALSEACKWQHWLARLLGRGRMCAGMKGNVPMARYLDTGDTFH